MQGKPGRVYAGFAENSPNLCKIAKILKRRHSHSTELNTSSTENRPSLPRIPDDYFSDPCRAATRSEGAAPASVVALRGGENVLGWLLVQFGLTLLGLPSKNHLNGEMYMKLAPLTLASLLLPVVAAADPATITGGMPGGTYQGVYGANLAQVLKSKGHDATLSNGSLKSYSY